MSNLFKSIHSEFLKLIFSKVTLIVMALVLILQTALAYICGKQYLSVGLNATPETDSRLAEPIPPLEYLGFDVILLGLMPMIVLGALYGANEYKRHCLRTTLLANGKKSVVLSSKMIVISIFSLIISLMSIFAAIATTHIALGSKGLNPLVLSPLVWKYIMYGSFSWMTLTVLAFSIGFLAKTPIIPLLFLIPQVYNLGDLLAAKFKFGEYLPFSLSDGLIATSPNALTETPAKNIALLLLWLVITGAIAYLSFHQSDVGGKY